MQPDGEQTPELNSEPVAEAPQQEPDSGDGGINPAWNPVLEKLPKEFHSQVIPHFQEWDRNHQQQVSKYDAYRPYVDNGIQPDTINQALQFLQAANQQPQAVVQWLTQQYGLTPQQAQQVVDDQVEEIDPDEDPVAAQLAAMQAKQDQIDQVIQREAERVETDRFYNQIDRDMKKLQATYGFNEVAGKRILEFANQRLQQTGKLDLTAAYQDYNNFVAEVRGQTRANDLAPTVLPTGGGVPPAPSTSFASMDEDERAEHFKRAMDAARRQQAN